MSNSNEHESLLRLLSTRAAKGKVPKGGANSADEKKTEETGRKRLTFGGSRNLSLTNKVPAQPLLENTQTEAKSPLSTLTFAKPHIALSPVGNAVMREAKRELGSQYGEDFHVSEENIARAVDRV